MTREIKVGRPTIIKDHDQVAKMYASGMSPSKISAALGVSRDAVKTALRRLGIYMNRDEKAQQKKMRPVEENLSPFHWQGKPSIFTRSHDFNGINQAKSISASRTSVNATPLIFEGTPKDVQYGKYINGRMVSAVEWIK